jgi:class 3 adenylate cyclase
MSEKKDEEKKRFIKRLTTAERNSKQTVTTHSNTNPGEQKKKEAPVKRLAPETSKRMSNIKFAKLKSWRQKKDNSKEKDKIDSFYVSNQKLGADFTHVPNMDLQFAMFYLHDDESTLWTLKITEETTAWQVCRKIEEKLSLKDHFDCFIRVYERSRDLYAVDRLIEDVEFIYEIREKWVVANLQARFVVRLLRISTHPTRIPTEGYVSGPKIISFLPDKVISRYLFAAGEPPTKPVREAFPAVVMFVDIAGFTSFTENLLKEGGDKGIEGLTIHLNQFFQKLIAVIKNHHGDIIQFGGDAILVVWHSPLHKLAVLAAAACFCGVDIQSTLADYHTSSGSKLSLYVAIAAGTMENIHVGSPENWIIVFGGEPVSQLSRIMGFCKPGEIVLSVECWSALRESQQDLKWSRKHTAETKRQRKGFMGMFSGRSGMEEEVPYQLHAILPTLKKPTGLGLAGLFF